MSIYSQTTAWTGQCSNVGQSPINLSQSSAKPCDLLCDLVFDDTYIPQAEVSISDEGLVLQNTSGLGSVKFNGEGYMCQTMLVTHPSHHTIENIQADGEVVSIFTNGSGKTLCVSTLFRVNPSQSTATHFFNSFIGYANPSVETTPVSLGENWGLFMQVPPQGAHYVYEGSLPVPPCSPCTWVVFKSMINIDSNDFALLVKNVSPGSRPIQALGDRTVYFNPVEQLPGGPMPIDGKSYMRCKRVAKKSDDQKGVRQVPLGDKQKDEEAKTPSGIKKWASEQVEINGILGVVDVVLMALAIYYGYYYGSSIGIQHPGDLAIGMWMAQKAGVIFVNIFSKIAGFLDISWWFKDHATQSRTETSP